MVEAPSEAKAEGLEESGEGWNGERLRHRRGGGTRWEQEGGRNGSDGRASRSASGGIGRRVVPHGRAGTYW
jgi:hypothetical protein